MTSVGSRHAALLTIAPPAARWYLALTSSTTRIREAGISEEELRERCEPPYVAVFWHNRLLQLAYRFRGPEYGALISDHADGELIARCVAGLGTRCVRVGTQSDRRIAMRQATRLLRQGVTCAVTPDGPLGPSGVAQPGAVVLASLAGAPLVPLAAATRHKMIFRSWDAFQVPLPFSRGVVAIGEPLNVPTELDASGIERYRGELEARLRRVTAQADRLVGD